MHARAASAGRPAGRVLPAWHGPLASLAWLLALLWCCGAGLPARAQGAQRAPTAPVAAAVAASAAGPAMRWRFRQPPQLGLIAPPSDLLDAAERAFLAGLPVLRVGLNQPDNRPYEVIGPDGEIAGIQVEILTHIAQALGLRLEPVVLPSFPEALAALRDRRIDLMATVGYDPAREAYLAYTLGTAPNPGAILGREADNRFATEGSLNGRRVAIERDYVTQYYVRRLWPDVLVHDQPDTASALRAVALGEDDYYFGSLLMAMGRLQREGITGLAVKRSLVYATGQMHFGVRSDWPLLASALSKGVAALRQAPMPSLQAALDALGAQAEGLTRALPLSAAEQRQVVGRSVLRVGAVRGLRLLNEATPGGGHAGIGADYTAQVAARLGTAVDVVPFDSVAQMLDALRAGRIHLVPLLTRTPGRAQDFAYSDPYLAMPYHVIARSDAPMYWDLQSLRGKRLALTAQHPLREYLADHYPDIRIVDAPPGDGAMDLVAAGGADAAVEAKLYANLRINGDNNGVLRQVSRVEEIPAQFHFAVSHEAAALVPLINRALADISPAERERLYRRWVAVDIAPAFPWQRHAPLITTAAAALALLAAASAWWMRRLAREARSRRLAEQRLRDVANSLPGVVFQYVAGADGQLEQRYFSDTVERFLGPGLLDAPSLFDAVAGRAPAADASALRDARAEALASLQPFKQTVRYDDPRHGPRWLHCEAVARRLDGGRVAWTGYIVDVSSERALQGRLLDAVQAKNLFVASASHELRAPLQAITLALQRLGSGPLDAAQRPVWQVARDASGTLIQLIDDVLDLARFESGRVRLQPAPVDLPALLAQIVEQHRLAAEARGLALVLDLAPGLPAQASLDALRLRQLLANLIGNALKYTPAGTVTLRASPLPGPAGGGLELLVADTGVGIAADRQAALFEPFATLQAVPAGHPAGERSTGLGLAICKRLVQAMQGEISLASQPGAGTQVRVRLPLRAAPAAEAPPPAAAPAPRHGPVLLVDDDPVSRLLMAETLRGAGYAVLEADDATQALAWWRAQDLAAVVSDRRMPGMDGATLLQCIADEAVASGRRAPCRLLCTGEADEAVPPAVQRVLAKPVSDAALADALAALGVRPGPPAA